MQPGPATRSWLASLAFAFCCLSPAFAASDATIWKRGDQIVQLAPQDDASALPNDHPVSTTPNEIGAILEMLRMRFLDDDTETAPASVFTPEEIDNLGKAIAAGLGHATPNQDILFHVIGAHRTSPGAWLKRNRVSAGRVFFRDGHLNIIFGQVQTPYRKKNLYGQTDEDFYPRNYGSRAAVAEHDVVLLAADGVRPYEANGGVRNDWMVISPHAATPALADREPEPQSAAIIAPAAGVSRNSSEPMEPMVEKSTPRDAPSEISRDRVTPPATNIERRLEELKRLRERELISEEVYQARMKEILQEL
ncbi:MAG: SHOCT domain-containing protein [Gammaproteobacteria bacterium]|nr:SHOCT domain-containing protein [Gammaproteobacteria bacterium]